MRSGLLSLLERAGHLGGMREICVSVRAFGRTGTSLCTPTHLARGALLTSITFSWHQAHSLPLDLTAAPPQPPPQSAFSRVAPRGAAAIICFKSSRASFTSAMERL